MYFYCYVIKQPIFQLIYKPIMQEKKIIFFSFAKLPLGVNMMSMILLAVYANDDKTFFWSDYVFSLKRK